MGAVLRFDSQPALYADPSWLPQWAVGSPRPLQLRLERELSSWLLAQQRVDGPCDWAACCAAARLFMMDARERDALALVTGVAAHRASLRQVVLHDRIEALRVGLGGALDVLWSPVAECVGHAESRLVVPWDVVGVDALRSRLRQDGLHQLLRLLNPDDVRQRAAAARAALCAPRRATGADARGLPAAQAERLSDALIEFAVPEWASAWTWLF